MATIVNGKVEFNKEDFGGVTVFGIDFKAPYQELFKWAYRRHDLQYQLFKNGGNKTRKQVDKEFLQDLKNIIKRKKKYYLYPLAHLLYGAVRVGGGYFWKNKNNALNINDINGGI